MKNDTRPAGLLMTFLACTAFMVFGGTAGATSLPPVNTNIVNAPTAQFIGSMVTSGGGKVPTTVTQVNPQFKDCAACTSWLDGAALTAAIAEFTNSGVQSVWNTSGFIGYVGKCVDSNTGLSCTAPQ